MGCTPWTAVESSGLARAQDLAQDGAVAARHTAAAARIDDPADLAAAGIAGLNRARRYSGISSATLSFRQVGGTQLLAGFNETPNDPQHERDRLAANAAAERLRVAAGADIVVLLTGANYNFGTTLGIAFIEPGMRDEAHAIVEIDGADLDATNFEHEVGHLFGAQHSNTDNATLQNVAASAHGHRYRTGVWPFRRWRKTIMMENAAGAGTELGHYSDPDVDAYGEPTGTGDRDNVAQLTAWADVVACYDRTTTFTARVSGPGQLTEGYPGTYTATTEGCAGSVSRRWSASTNGRDYVNYGTGSSQTLSAPRANALYVRLSATCSNGQTAQAAFTTLVRSEECGDGILCLTGGGSPSPAPASARSLTARGGTTTGALAGPLTFEVFPNPATAGYATLNYISSRSPTAEVSILDALGRRVRGFEVGTSRVDGASEQVTLATDGLPAGRYTVQLVRGGEVARKALHVLNP